MPSLPQPAFISLYFSIGSFAHLLVVLSHDTTCLHVALIRLIFIWAL